MVREEVAFCIRLFITASYTEPCPGAYYELCTAANTLPSIRFFRLFETPDPCYIHPRLTLRINGSVLSVTLIQV